MQLTARDLQRLEGVHPDLVRVVARAAETTPIAFMVGEGLRTRERQAQLVRQGRSWTQNSRHLTGHAVDLIVLTDQDGDGDIEVSWRWQDYDRFAPVMKAAGLELGVFLDWGGDWRQKDGPHWQLPWKTYPASRGEG